MESFKNYFKCWIDIIAVQQDSSGSTYNFLMSDEREYSVRKMKEFRGGKSGDSVIMIEIEGNNYVLKVFSEGNRDKMVMNAKEIDIHKDIIDIFKDDYESQKYVPCPFIYCYGYMKEVEYNSDPKNDGYLRYVIMELISPTYELYDYIYEKCTDKKVLYENLNLKSIILQIFYFIGNILINGISHCDLHMKNIMIVPHHSYVLSFSKITNDDIVIDTKDYAIKVIDYGLSEDRDIPCSKIRRTTASLNELNKICGGRSNLWILVLGELRLLKGSISDLNFLYKIIDVFSRVDKSLSKIDTEKIKKYAALTYNVRDKNEKKKILSEILKLIL
jgi:hypothetical protein